MPNIIIVIMNATPCSPTTTTFLEIAFFLKVNWVDDNPPVKLPKKEAVRAPPNLLAAITFNLKQ